MTEQNTVKGYKVFNPDWTCRSKQYTCPGKFEEKVVPSMCKKGMHFCKKLVDCFNYYPFDPANHVAEVVTYGQVVESGDKCATDKLEIVREIPWHEVLDMVNTGNGNSGKKNSGNRNSGNWNSGNWNNGNWNNGNWNSGDCNGGNWNSGNWNSGNCNSGDCNSGNWNSGNWNSGDWNSGNYSTGCFNTVVSTIDFFNRPSDWTHQDWLDSEARMVLSGMPFNHDEWCNLSSMSNVEKAEHPEAKTTGGYLKRIVAGKEEVNQWWKELKAKDKKAVMALPNFDSAIFEEVTGIKIESDEQYR